jgi:hypothetical protein
MCFMLLFFTIAATLIFQLGFSVFCFYLKEAKSGLA